ncbi:MAG TPA: lipopolysaccharide kinase InaA family protein [Humisphaera sp.]|nr:lipopolysaccharide kinase InaA family protein [Humisphaera sp.]
MASDTIHVAAGAQPLLRELGIDAQSVFDHPKIIPWRTLPDRENCTLDAKLIDGRAIRWHVKRYAPARRKSAAALDEMRGHQLLIDERIATAPLVAWGAFGDGRSFVIFEDLAGYAPADKLIARGTRFESLLRPTADLAAALHRAGLHHRDLYLCHFMAKISGDTIDLKLIDTARVRKLPGMLTRRRWIVKDLAQFWYSTLPLAITDEQRRAWLARYAEQRGLVSAVNLGPAIQRKAKQIGRHDVRLNRRQPRRNISISS